MNELKHYFKSIYRLSLNPEKRGAIVWNDLKKLFQSMEWKHGVFEQERYIETGFDIAQDKWASFVYSVYDRRVECFVKVNVLLK